MTLTSRAIGLPRRERREQVTPLLKYHNTDSTYGT